MDWWYDEIVCLAVIYKGFVENPGCPYKTPIADCQRLVDYFSQIDKFAAVKSEGFEKRQ